MDWQSRLQVLQGVAVVSLRAVAQLGARIPHVCLLGGDELLEPLFLDVHIAFVLEEWNLAGH